MVFFDTLIQVLRLFIIIVFGYVLGKKNWISKNGQREISTILLYVAMPCAIIRGMQIPFSREKFSIGLSIIVIMGITYGLITLMSFALVKLIPSKGKERDVLQLSMILPNVGYMGYSIVGQVLGMENIFYATLASLFFEFTAWSVGMYLISRNAEVKSSHNIFYKSIVNPGVLSVLTGLVLFLLKVSIPEPLKGAIEVSGSMMSPLAMIIIGVSLSRARVREFIFNYKIYLVSFFKLLLIPFVMMGIYYLAGSDGMKIMVPTMLVAMPSASYVTIFATNLGSDETLASQIASVCTVLSMVTIPFVVGVLQYVK